MLEITNTLCISMSEIELTPIRAQGADGQHVNKVSTAIHLRFNIEQSSLPPELQTRLLQLRDYRITRDGMVIIKAQRYRSQDKNREDALCRLRTVIKKGLFVPASRIKTKPSKQSVKNRLDSKKRRGHLKKLRQSTE